MGLIERVASQIAGGTTPLRPIDVEREARRLLEVEAPHQSAWQAQDVVDGVLGLGPLQAALRDPSVTDILVNGPDEIWVERAGELSRENMTFENSDSLVAAVDRVISPLGLRLDRSSPFVDARLQDGSRLHAVIPPASVDYPVVAIRRFTQTVDTLDDLVGLGTATAQQLEEIATLVEKRRTILISGGTGTGKTTLLNLISRLLPDGDRIVTIEDAAELEIRGHVVRLEAHPSNTEGAGEVTIKQLLRSALRLRPDRIILGEVRGAEALDLIMALNTGHHGSMSTIHANSPDEALWRLETLALSAGDVGSESISRQLRAAIGAVVQMERAGSVRRLTTISRVDDA